MGHVEAHASVLLSNADGSFRLAGRLGSGEPGWEGGLTVGDFNADGRPDIAMDGPPVIYGRDPDFFHNSTLDVFLGNGDGSFQLVDTYQLGGGPFVVPGDFNADGHLDLITQGYLGIDGDYVPRVFLGHGDGTFRAGIQIEVPISQPARGTVGDFNGDGYSDLIISVGYSPEWFMLLSNGDGTFLRSTGSSCRGSTAADFDLDGNLDLVEEIQSRDVVHVHLGNGDGSCQSIEEHVVGTRPVGAVARDLNLDGFPDLAVVNSVSQSVSVLLNDGYWIGPVVSYSILPDGGTVAAGTPLDVSVLALNAEFEIVTNYTGEILFWSIDPKAALPDVYRFQRADGGVAYFPEGLTFHTPGVQVLYVLDTATFTVIGYAVFDVVGEGPGPGGGAGDGRAPDLFAGQELDRAVSSSVPRQAALEAVPSTRLRQVVAPLASDPPGPPAPTAGTSPAARLERVEVVLDQLFGKLEEHWLTA